LATTLTTTRSPAVPEPGKSVVCNLVLLDRTTGELFDLGEFDEDEGEPIPTAIQRAGIPHLGISVLKMSIPGESSLGATLIRSIPPAVSI
jgi:hypothetical protein